MPRAASRGESSPGTRSRPRPAPPRWPAPGKSCLCEYGSSYIGILPANNPQLVVAVNVQDPTKGGYFGDEIAGPVFYHVAKFALQTLRIPPDGASVPSQAHGTVSSHARALTAVNRGNLCPCQPICAHAMSPCDRSRDSRRCSGSGRRAGTRPAR